MKQIKTQPSGDEMGFVNREVSTGNVARKRKCEPVGGDSPDFGRFNSCGVVLY